MNENKENIKKNNNNDEEKVENKEEDINLKKKIKYIPYYKINKKKPIYNTLIQDKKNENKQIVSEDKNDTNLNDNNKKDNLLSNDSLNSINSSSYKNIFCNRISLSNYKNIFKKKKEKRNPYFLNKFNNFSVKKIIFNKKKFKDNLSLTEKTIKIRSIKKSATLPELKTNNFNKFKGSNLIENLNIKNHIRKKFSFRVKTIFDDKIKCYRAKSVCSESYNINEKNKNKNKNKNNYSSSTSAFTNTTKQINNTNKSNNAADDLNNYKLGLLTAGTSSYNNVIIPIISLNRQLKGDSNMNTINNRSETKKENKPTDKDDSFILKTNNNNLKKFILKKKHKNTEILYDTEQSNDIYKNMEKLIPRFHKIKIEKGMMNKKIVNSLGKKLFINYYNPKNQTNKIPLIFSDDKKSK